MLRMPSRIHPKYQNPNVLAIGQGEAMDRKFKRLEAGGCQISDCFGGVRS
jgi:hypothetical protein